MRLNQWAICMILLAGGTPAFAEQVPGKAVMNLEKEIHGRLQKDADLKNNQIDVKVDNGVATLKGNVDNEAERAKAAALARVSGVTRVDDQLEVGSKGLKNAVTDTALTTKLKGQFVADEALRGSDVSVTTNNGVVTLTGTVPSAAVRQKAVDMARNSDGVMRVDDKLRVVTPGQPAPATPTPSPAPAR